MALKIHHQTWKYCWVNVMRYFFENQPVLILCWHSACVALVSWHHMWSQNNKKNFCCYPFRWDSFGNQLSFKIRTTLFFIMSDELSTTTMLTFVLMESVLCQAPRFKHNRVDCSQDLLHAVIPLILSFLDHSGLGLNWCTNRDRHFGSDQKETQSPSPLRSGD